MTAKELIIELIECNLESDVLISVGDAEFSISDVNRPSYYHKSTVIGIEADENKIAESVGADIRKEDE